MASMRLYTIEIPWWQAPLKNLLMILIVASALLAGVIAPAILQGCGMDFLPLKAC